MRVGIYTRVSQARGKKRGKSTGEQDAETTADVEANVPGAEIVVRYCDDDRGASRYSKGRRPDWERLLDDLRAHRLDMLATWEASRAQRDLEVYVELRRICRDNGILWRYDGHTYDLNNDDDAYRTGQDALDAEREAGKTRKRVLRAVRSRAAAGRPHGKHLYGYRREYDPATGDYIRTVVDPITGPTVREMYRRYADGDGITAIATDLTRRGVPTPQGAPVWRSSTIRNLIRNPGHLGQRASRAGHATIEDAWPALVDETLWRRVQARLTDPERTPRGDVGVKHLLSGLAICGVCGGKLAYNTGRNRKSDKAYPTYICHDRRCVGRQAGEWSPVADEVRGLEGQVVEYVLTLWDDDERIGRDDDDPRIAELEADKQALQARLDAFRESAADPDGPSPAAVAAVERKLLPKIETCDAELTQLRARISVPDVGKRSVREAWPKLSLAQRRQIIAVSVTIRVLPAGSGKRYDPATVTIKPRWAEK
jgi:DNA invertase Pin-like site-specific DNA recombinase